MAENVFEITTGKEKGKVRLCAYRYGRRENLSFEIVGLPKDKEQELKLFLTSPQQLRAQDSRGETCMIEHKPIDGRAWFIQAMAQLASLGPGWAVTDCAWDNGGWDHR